MYRKRPTRGLHASLIKSVGRAVQSMATLDLSDPAIADAIATVRSDATPQTYCILSYKSKSTLGVETLGEGSAFAAIDEMEDDKVSYALLRVANTRDQESKTVKFCFVTYVGPSVGGMARGRVGAHKGQVKALVGQSTLRCRRTIATTSPNRRYRQAQEGLRREL